MVTKEHCFDLYKKYGDMNVVLDSLGIDVIEKDFKQKTLESQIVIDHSGNATIFIRPDLDYLYIQFLLAHELGHYVLHYDTDISFNYYCRIYKTKTEREANDFACELLLSDVNSANGCLDFINKEKGIPDKIWYTYADIMKLEGKQC